MPRKALLAPLVKEIEAGHAECRKRKLGQCLMQVRIKPDNGHKTFLCGTPEDTKASR